MLESSKYIGAGLATIGLAGDFLDIISKKNIEGWFAFLESYNLDIVFALLIISLIFMWGGDTHEQDARLYLDPNSRTRILLSDNPERYTLSRIILWQIVQNCYARQHGCPVYSLNNFETTALGYLSPSEYKLLGSTILPSSEGTRARYFLASNATDILDRERYTEFPGGNAVINDENSSRLAHAGGLILETVIHYEYAKWKKSVGK